MRSALAAMLVSLTALSLAAQQPPRWNLVPELRIGGDATTGPEYEFTTIREIAIGPGGSIYVVQGQEQEIRVYDAQGKYVRTIGRQGGGPGEFTGLRTIGFMGDTLYTTDTRLMRITLFRADGSLITTIAAEAAASAPRRNAAPFRPIPSALLPDGSVLGGSSFASDLVSSGQITAWPVFRLTRTASVLDTIAWIPVGSGQGTIQSGNSTLFFGQPISDDALWTLAGPAQRVYVVTRSTRSGSTAFRVTAISATGDTLWSRSYPYRPIPLGAGVADSIVDMLMRQFSDVRERYTADQIRKAVFIPDHQPAVSRAFAAADGSLWLRREEFGERLTWTVLAPNGDIAATLSLPHNVRPMTVIGDKAWGVELDDVDVPLLVRYRIRK